MRGTTKALGKKHALDKFYTKPEIASQCLAALSLGDYDLVVEPSAGSGSFSSQIPGCVALDLEPEHGDIIQQNFFNYTPPSQEGARKILVVGNPPFGQQGSLAVRFFNHAAMFADTVAFIVPRSFNKISIQNRIDIRLHLRSSVVLPKNSFTLHGVSYDVPCVFQIWDQQSIPRSITRAIATSSVIEFVPADGNPDFTIRRVGGSAGKASLRVDMSAQSNYFVRNISSLTTEALIEHINALQFPSRDDSVGPRSLSRGELVDVLDGSFKS